MDEMKISSKFARSMISKLIAKVIKKKAGYNIGIQLNELDIVVIDGRAHMHLNTDVELNNEELENLISKFIM